MRNLATLVAAVLLLAVAPPARAHGGQYRTPALPPPPSGGVPGRTATDTGWEGWWWSHQDPVVDRARRRAAAADPALEATGLGPAGENLDGAPAPPREPDPRLIFEREILPILTRSLSEGEAEVRSAAAVALGKMGYARSFLPLHEALRDEHPDVRDGAVLALGMVGDPFAFEDLRGILFDPAVTERTRGFAALATGMAGGDGGVALLLSFLAPSADAARVGGIRRSEDLECCAVVALGRTASPVAAAWIRKELVAGARGAMPVRCCMAVALGRIGDRESIPLLLQGLAHEDARMRQSAAVGLGMVATPADRAAVEALAKSAREDQDAGARTCALQALGAVGGPAAVETLRAAYREGRGGEQTAAAIALGCAGDLGVGPFLHRAFRDSGNSWSRGALALALGAMGYRPASEDLRATALGKEDGTLRGYAVTALGILGGAGAAEDLRRVLLEDRDPWLRCTAARGLRLLKDRRAVAPLQALATGKGPVHERAQSCYFLGILGGPEAMRTLLRVVDDRDEEMIVRMHAVAGLGVLADRSPVPILSSLGADTNWLLPIAPLQEVQTFL